MDEVVTRRSFLAQATATGTFSRLGARLVAFGEDGRLTARPGPATLTAEAGERRLGLGTTRDGFLYVPSGVDLKRPIPLAVMLHGASNQARAMQFTYPLADQFGVAIVAPDSREQTWDVVRDKFGVDVRFIDEALKHVFARLTVDHRRLAIGGFSDGASCALSLGTINGDLFTHVIAFSPGFIAPGTRYGKPRIFVSHGTADRVLPVAFTSRLTVRRLSTDGYGVTYREFDGSHSVPPPIARQAFEWFLA
jgi:predicted esterase